MSNRDWYKDKSYTNNEHQYDDIINLPHHVSTKHPHMDLLDRAAQFSPFAALTGHAAAINETARRAVERMESNENRIETMDGEEKYN